MLSKRTRDRLLSIARIFDRCAARIRTYVQTQTPKRARKEQPETVG